MLRSRNPKFENCRKDSRDRISYRPLAPQALLVKTSTETAPVLCINTLNRSGKIYDKQNNFCVSTDQAKPLCFVYHFLCNSYQLLI